jgi:hypothetical protein
MVTVLIALLLVVGVLWYLSSPHRRTRLRGRWLKRQVERGKAQWGRQRPKPHTANVPNHTRLQDADAAAWVASS